MIMTYIELSVWFSLLLNSVCSFERRQLSPLFAQILDFIRGHILNWLKSMISVKSFRLLIEFNCIICHQMETDLRCIGIHCSSCLMEFLKQFVSIEKKKKHRSDEWIWYDVNLVRCDKNWCMHTFTIVQSFKSNKSLHIECIPFRTRFPLAK